MNTIWAAAVNSVVLEVYKQNACESVSYSHIAVFCTDDGNPWCKLEKYMKYKAKKHLTKWNIFGILKSDGMPPSRLVAKAKKTLKGYTGFERFFVTNLFRIKRRKGTIMKSKISRFAAATLVLVAGVLLAACGGGGDASNPVACSSGQVWTGSSCVGQASAQPSWDNATVTVAQAPAVSQEAAAPMLALAKMETVSQDPYNGVVKSEAFRQAFAFAESNLPDLFPVGPATQIYLPGGTTVEYRFYQSTGIYLGFARDSETGSGWEEAGVYVMGAQFGNSPVYMGHIMDYFTPVPPTQTVQWYDPPVTVTVNSMHNWVVGANQLPAGCISFDQSCWKESMASSTVKFIKTSAKMIGLSNGRDTRPIVFAYYITADGQRWNTLPVFEDTGEPTNEINGGGSFVISRVIGNDLGIIFEVSGSCFQKRWYPDGDPSGRANIWANEQVACPAE